MARGSKGNSGIFIRALGYIKNNLVIGYSLILLLLVPAAFFGENYLINTNYAGVIDGITQKKAILAEGILNDLVYEKFSDTAALQSLVDRVVSNNSEIISLSILSPRPGESAYDVIASSDHAAVGTVQQETSQIFLASTNPNSTFLDENGEGRFWKVIKAVHGGEGDKRIGYLDMSLSLAESDLAMNNVITGSYWVLALIILVLVLLQANQIRLLGYALNLNKLKEIDKMKDMFISMASHELRTPLTAVKWYVDALKGKKDLQLDSESRQNIANMGVSVERLETLVDDILDVSRIEGNRLPMEIKIFDPSPVIFQSLEEIRSQAVIKGLELNYKPAAAPVRIAADSNRLKQIIVNLVGNAVKYTEKGSVDVSTAVRKNEFLLTVADTGIGMASEDRVNLFEKFYRIKNERTKDIAGTGLGLWITLEIARKMNGNVTVESIEGVGSHFTLHLPLSKI